MDGESCYESDVSESWSLIDINLNEEPVTAIEAYSFLQNKNISLSDLESEKEKLLIEDNNENVNCESKLENCKSGLQKGYNKFGYDVENLRRIESEETSIIDSCDAESIEILNTDENSDSDIDNLDISFINSELQCPSDNEESFYKQNTDNTTFKNSTTVIKRKILNTNSDTSKNSVNRCCNSSEAYFNGLEKNINLSSNSISNNSCTSSTNSQPVYKHYRNNVANTALSLSVGVIFAGVACLAIGHFLGVQDAGETSVEILETVKKLQKENVALHSRLSNLNEALNTWDTNLKMQMPSGLSTKKNVNNNEQIVEFENNPKSQLLPKTSKSIEWLSKLQNFVKVQKKCLNDENLIAFDQIVTWVHDGLTFLSKTKEDYSKLKDFEETNAKISKTLKKIIDRLASSQDSIEVLHENLFELKSKLNKKLKKFFLDFLKKEREKKVFYKDKTDFSRIQWEQKRKETDPIRKKQGSLAVSYEFLQPNENVIKENIVLYSKNQPETIERKEFKENNINMFLNKTHKVSQEEIKIGDIEKERKKKNSSNNQKKIKEKRNEKKRKMTLKEKETKRNQKKGRNAVIRSDFEKTKKIFENNQMKEINNYQTEKRKEKFFNKNISKKKKASEFYRASLSHLPKTYRFKKNKNGDALPSIRKGLKKSEILNMTGYWVFKWADGREKFRYHQKVGEWQFERAKGRRESKHNDYVLNWQFERAKGRRESRRNDHTLNWQYKGALARERSRYNDRWYYDENKFRNYNGKRFLHKEFSSM